MGVIALVIIFFLPLGLDDAVKEKLSTPYDLKIYFEKRELATDEITSIEEKLISIEKDINKDEVILEQEILVDDLLTHEDVLMVEE